MGPHREIGQIFSAFELMNRQALIFCEFSIYSFHFPSRASEKPRAVTQEELPEYVAKATGCVCGHGAKEN